MAFPDRASLQEKRFAALKKEVDELKGKLQKEKQKSLAEAQDSAGREQSKPWSALPVRHRIFQEQKRISAGSSDAPAEAVRSLAEQVRVHKRE